VVGTILRFDARAPARRFCRGGPNARERVRGRLGARGDEPGDEREQLVAGEVLARLLGREQAGEHVVAGALAALFDHLVDQREELLAIAHPGEALGPQLRESDALWLPTAAGSHVQGPATLARTVELDLERDTDRRTHRNLVADLVYLPALEAEEFQTGAWKDCARALVVDSKGPYAEALIKTACEARVTAYAWAEGTTELRCGGL